MLRRLGSGVALASMAALVLVGCTPPEPTEEELVAQVSETTEGFFQAVGDQLSSGSASPSALGGYATDQVAETWAADIQAALDSGDSSSGALTVTGVEIVEETANGIDALLCTDDSGVTTTHADGTTASPNGLVAWEVHLIRAEETAGLLIDALEPIADESVCGA